MRSPFVPGDGVDLVHDQRLDAAEHRPTAVRRHQEIQGFGSGDEEVRGAFQHGSPLRGGRVTGPDRHAKVRRAEPQLIGDLRYLPEGRLQVLMDVHGQGLQRRDVNDLRPLAKARGLFVGAVQAVDAHEEGSQRLSRAGRGRDQRVAARGDLTPASLLGRRWPVREGALEPRAHGGMEGFEHAATLPPAADNLPCGGRASGPPATRY